MGLFFKKQKHIYFTHQDEVTEYWKKKGAHSLNTSEIKAMQDLMIDDVTFKITTNFFCKNIKPPKPSDKLLDAGCGWGRSIIGLKRKFPTLDVTGVDVVEELLELGKNITKKININNVNWKKETVVHLSFDDNYFTNIVSTRVLHYIVEPQNAINELLRVLKPGGRMIIMVPNKLNLLLRISYHTKLYSAEDMKSWFPTCKVNIIKTGTIGFIPPFKHLRNAIFLEKLDVILRKIPLINKFGGLVFCIVEKN